MPGPGDSRVKAYRKQAREGTLPPVLMWWVSGLDCHLILDGHARLAAAIAESVEPPLLRLHRAVARDDLAVRIDDAVGFYESELTRFAGLRTVHGPTVPDGAATTGPGSPVSSTTCKPLGSRPGPGPCQKGRTGGGASPAR
ncbi:hypothetical protein [[Kitasatospora] papulosa]|uniref:hypothetical protein n=1 Tax=[Kitasatospora] papulosa TaxID=1464011 RepID=UPI0036A22868